MKGKKRYLNKKIVFELSKKYSSPTEFSQKDQTAYKFASKHYILEEIKVQNKWPIYETPNSIKKLNCSYIENEIKKRKQSKNWRFYSEQKQKEIINRLRNLREF